MSEAPAKGNGDGWAAGTERRPAYRSWKKKYRKMRIEFDNKMHDGEELHRQEAKASTTVKRLAVENDRLLDLLVEINNSPQIPPERRIDVSLPLSTESDVPGLPIDHEHSERKSLAMRHLAALLSEIPHTSFGATKETQPAVTDDLVAADGDPHPAHFLSADDVDNYIYAVDANLESDSLLPTLAPRANPNAHPSSNPQLKNPTSVTNWLRKHAPKIFLQDGEAHGAADGGGGGGGDDADTANPAAGAATTGSGRRARGGTRGERGGRGSARGKRPSTSARAKAGAAAATAAATAAAAAADRSVDWDASMDDDPDFGATPTTGRGGKRKRDDDPGYRPRGSASRPAKKKRKSNAEGTPSARKGGKKDTVIVAAKDE